MLSRCTMVHGKLYRANTLYFLVTSTLQCPTCCGTKSEHTVFTNVMHINRMHCPPPPAIHGASIRHEPWCIVAVYIIVPYHVRYMDKGWWVQVTGGLVCTSSHGAPPPPKKKSANVACVTWAFSPQTHHFTVLPIFRVLWRFQTWDPNCVTGDIPFHAHFECGLKMTRVTMQGPETVGVM